MELRQLRYFVRVAETLHFGRAAAKEFVSQSVISTQIQSLETELGFRLFERSSHHVSLTPAGAVFLKEVEQTLAALGSAVSGARDVARGTLRRLRVGTFAEGAGPLTHLIFSAFRDAAVDVELQYVELSMVNQLDAVRNGDVDVALLRLPVTDASLHVEPLYAEPRVAVVPADDELASAASLSVEDLIDRPFAVAAEGAPVDWRSYWSFDDERGGLSRVGGEVRSVPESLAAVAYGHAVDTYPATAAAMFPHPGVRFIPLTDAELSSLAIVSVASADGDDAASRFREVASGIVDQYLHLIPGAVRLGPAG
ncbi:LysR family transcriptional regulator [Microbacterium kribbense]|uniref:LysR family transcriptional regulator n=2 Tax=Microbacterium kribbense TaxID=433645 RepID=A0ABP7GYL1_9MICO